VRRLLRVGCDRSVFMLPSGRPYPCGVRCQANLSAGDHHRSHDAKVSRDRSTKRGEPAAMHVQDIAYEADGMVMVGQLAFDDSVEGPEPGVLVAYEGPGNRRRSARIPVQRNDGGRLARWMAVAADADARSPGPPPGGRATGVRRHVGSPRGKAGSPRSESGCGRR
jgi:hypothetical protein